MKERKSEPSLGGTGVEVEVEGEGNGEEREVAFARLGEMCLRL